MAKIRSVLNCPNCDEDVVASGSAASCPKCDFPLGPRATGYQYPEYLSEYFLKTQDEKWLRDTVLAMPLEKIKFLLADTQEVLRLATGKKCSQEDIRMVAEIAVRIGKMGKGIIDLLDSGCRHVPGLYVNNINKETENVEHSQAATGGERPATGAANITPAFFPESSGRRDTG